MSKSHIIEVDYHTAIKGGHRLKVSVLSYGLYIDGFTARPSERNDSGWWVQPPSIRVGNGWQHIIGFDKSLSLWQEIEQACIDAVNRQIAAQSAPEASVESVLDELSFLDSQEKGLPGSDAAAGKAVPWLEDD